MNKNELLRWLKSEKEAALIAFRNTFEINRKEKKEQIYKACGADVLIKNLKEFTYKEEELINAFNNINTEKMGFKTYYLRNDPDDYLKISDESYRSFERSFDTERGKIIHNYDNVVRQVKLLPLKEATEWLTELGFEIPLEIAGTQKNEIVVQVDPSYLRLRK